MAGRERRTPFAEDDDDAVTRGRRRSPEMAPRVTASCSSSSTTTLRPPSQPMHIISYHNSILNPYEAYFRVVPKAEFVFFLASSVDGCCYDDDDVDLCKCVFSSLSLLYLQKMLRSCMHREKSQMLQRCVFFCQPVEKKDEKTVEELEEDICSLF